MAPRLRKGREGLFRWHANWSRHSNRESKEYLPRLWCLAASWVRRIYLPRVAPLRMNLKANHILAFVPAQRRYDEAIEFYQEIGFTIDYRSDSISVIRKDNCKFFLQNVNYEYADGNFMMTLEVEDLDAWWQHLS